MSAFLFALLISMAPSGYASLDDGSLIRPVNQSFSGDHELSILPLVGVGKEFQGRLILQLVLKAHAENGSAVATASVGGFDIAPYRSIRAESGGAYVFDLTGAEQRIERIDDFQFHVRGSLVVEAVGLRLAPIDPGQPPGPHRPQPLPAPPPPREPLPVPDPAPRPTPAPPHPPRPRAPEPRPEPRPAPRPPAPIPAPRPEGPVEHATIWVRDSFSSGDGLRLSELFDFSPYIGFRVRNVTLTGQSRSGATHMLFCAESHCPGGTLPYFRASLRWHAEVPVTQPDPEWRFQFEGDLFVERIDLELVPGCEPE